MNKGELIPQEGMDDLFNTTKQNISCKGILYNCRKRAKSHRIQLFGNSERLPWLYVGFIKRAATCRDFRQVRCVATLLHFCNDRKKQMKLVAKGILGLP